MGRIAYVKFYPQDWLVGVSDLDMTERGQYMTLLCIQHQKGRLTRKAIELSLGVKIKEISPDVLTKFLVDAGGNFYNERMEEEINKIAYTSQIQTDKITKRWLSVKPEAEQKGYPGNTAVYTDVYTGAIPIIYDSDYDLKNKKKEESEKKEEKEKNLLKREENFRLVVRSFDYSTGYTIEMINQFCDYWTEPNKSRTKMRFELEKVFDIPRRLRTWHSRSKESKTFEVKGDLITYKELVYRFNQGESDMWEKYEQVTPGDKRSLWKSKPKNI